MTTKAPVPAELLGDGGADPAAAAGDDDDPASVAHDGAVGRTSSSRPSKLAVGQPVLEQVAVAEVVAEAAAVVAVARVHRLGVALVVDPRRRARRHDAAAVDEASRRSSAVQALLGLGAHVERPRRRACSSRPTVPADELGAEHRELGVVDGDDGLLRRAPA